MGGGSLDVLLIGPLVFSEIEDKLRNNTSLVISSSPERLEDYCDAKEIEFPSLMTTQERWHGGIMQLKDGQIQVKSLPAEVGMTSSTDMVRNIVFFKDWAILAVCLGTISHEEIKEVLRGNGLPEVLSIQPA